jgi:hypothetical protein
MTWRQEQMFSIWKFETANFTIDCSIEHECGYQYDGDDESGEIQQQLDDGLLIAFTTRIRVTHRETGAILGEDYLSGSIYADPREFIKEHYGCKPKGYSSYFPDMVRSAISEARKTFAMLQRQKLREAA